MATSRKEKKEKPDVYHPNNSFTSEITKACRITANENKYEIKYIYQNNVG